jgi:hypothetical protein
LTLVNIKFKEKVSKWYFCRQVHIQASDLNHFNFVFCFVVFSLRNFSLIPHLGGKKNSDSFFFFVKNPFFSLTVIAEAKKFNQKFKADGLAAAQTTFVFVFF